jgi:hypothetical protein
MYSFRRDASVVGIGRSAILARLWGVPIYPRLIECLTLSSLRRKSKSSTRSASASPIRIPVTEGRNFRHPTTSRNLIAEIAEWATYPSLPSLEVDGYTNYRARNVEVQEPVSVCIVYGHVAIASLQRDSGLDSVTEKSADRIIQL